MKHRKPRQPPQQSQDKLNEFSWTLGNLLKTCVIAFSFSFSFLSASTFQRPQLEVLDFPRRGKNFPSAVDYWVTLFSHLRGPTTLYNGCFVLIFGPRRIRLPVQASANWGFWGWQKHTAFEFHLWYLRGSFPYNRSVSFCSLLIFSMMPRLSLSLFFFLKKKKSWVSGLFHCFICNQEVNLL